MDPERPTPTELAAHRQWVDDLVNHKWPELMDRPEWGSRKMDNTVLLEAGLNTYTLAGEWVARCGRQVLYTPNLDEPEAIGIFWLDAKQCELDFKKRGYHVPCGLDQHILFRWLTNRDPAIPIAPVPQLWSHALGFTIVSLLEKGDMKAFCPLCAQVVVPVKQPPKPDPRPISGWIYDTFCCPSGHTLLKVKVAHFKF